MILVEEEVVLSMDRHLVGRESVDDDAMVDGSRFYRSGLATAINRCTIIFIPQRLFDIFFQYIGISMLEENTFNLVNNIFRITSETMVKKKCFNCFVMLLITKQTQ